MGGIGCINCDWCALLLGDFDAKVRSEDIFKPKIWNKNLHESNNYNGVKVVNFATLEDFIVKSTKFPHPRSHTFS